jgi:hypothetical protein
MMHNLNRVNPRILGLSAVQSLKPKGEREKVRKDSKRVEAKRK